MTNVITAIAAALPCCSSEKAFSQVSSESTSVLWSGPPGGTVITKK